MVNGGIAPKMTFPPKTHGMLRLLWIFGIGVVTIGSLLPSSSGPIRALNSLQLSDKLEHFFAYAFLAFLPTLHERRQFVLCAAFAALFLGLTLEFAQLFADGRSWELSDLGADVAGVCVGVLAGIPIRNVPIVRSLRDRVSRQMP